MLHIVVLAFACWRLSRLLADPSEAGPADILVKLRFWLGWRWDEYNHLYFASSGITRQLAMGMSCMKCNSVWIGIGLAVAYYFFNIIAIYLMLPLALSGFVVLTEEALNAKL